MTDERLDSVAVICDGNGRWAKMRHLIRSQGHVEGAKRIQPALETFRRIGVHYVTLYAFSTENWKRPKDEVDVIMKLVYKYLVEVVEEKLKVDKDFSVKFIGDLTPIPEPLRSKCIEIEEKSKGGAFVCSVALNYGGRDEILRSVRAFAQDVRDGKRNPEDLTEGLFDSYLDSAGVPDPELVIRPSGEKRTSNFLPWQTVYSEFVFMNVLWPDFGPKELDEAIEEYHRRNRRFGGA